MPSRDQIDQVLQSINIVTLISKRVELKKQGTRWVGLCPFHPEKSPSFYVSPDGYYYCFGCKAGGDAIQFLRNIDSLDFIDALSILANETKISITFNNEDDKQYKQKAELLAVLEASTVFFEKNLKNNKEILAYLRNRGITEESQRVFRLGFAPKNSYIKHISKNTNLIIASGLAKNQDNNLIESMLDRITFPIFDNIGRPIAFGGRSLQNNRAKYKNFTETVLYSKRKTLYGLNIAKTEIAKKRNVYICEGYLDLIWMYQAGYLNTVAICGTALTEQHINILRQYTDTITLVFDSDDAGQKATSSIAEAEKKFDILVYAVYLPPDEDPANLGENNNLEILHKAIVQAEPLYLYRINRLLEQQNLDTSAGRNRGAKDVIDILTEHNIDFVDDAILYDVAHRCGISTAILKNRISKNKNSKNTKQDNQLPVSTTIAPSDMDILRLYIHCYNDVHDLCDIKLLDSEDGKNIFVLFSIYKDIQKAANNTDEHCASFLRQIAFDPPPSIASIGSPRKIMSRIIAQQAGARLARIPSKTLDTIAFNTNIRKHIADINNNKGNVEKSTKFLLDWLKNIH